MGSAKSSQHHEFLNPICSAGTLDKFLIRQRILMALCAQLHEFKGTVLDIGSGTMPYKSLVLSPPSRAERYFGLDLKDNIYQRPDLEWDGEKLPLEDNSVDCVLATEVLEHCPDVDVVLRESQRALKPDGLFFFTVPFLWPLHDVPHDEYRYTPFSLARHLRDAGFTSIKLRPLGGWDASLAQMLGLWVRRRPMSSRIRRILSALALPIIRFLVSSDRLPQEFGESCMITGLSGTARKLPR
jgi:SAM-dependent methyltransferase